MKLYNDLIIENSKLHERINAQKEVIDFLEEQLKKEREIVYKREKKIDNIGFQIKEIMKILKD